MHCPFVHFTNIAIAIFGLFFIARIIHSYGFPNFTIAKFVALNLLAYFFVSILKIDSWRLFYIASHYTVIAHPTIVTAIVVALLRS